ncbi:MAG: hypothetical protein ACREUK_00190, partial [Burkholderiales bacterium]
PRRGLLPSGGTHAIEIAHFPVQAAQMLKLVFAEAGIGPTLEAGPFNEILINGEAMCEGDGGRIIATHRDHHWVPSSTFPAPTASPSATG